MRIHVLLFFLSVTCAWPAKHLEQDREALFNKYPVADILTSIPNINWNQKLARHYRAKISKTLGAPPNFAGHYSILSLGCGTECLMGLLIDRKSGRVTQIPIGAERHYDSRSSSRVLFIDGRPYLFDEAEGEKFKLLK